MFFHTSLAAQWLILLTFYLWFCDTYELRLWKRCIITGGLGILSISIHPYLWMMCAVILLFSFIDELIRTRRILPVLICGSVFSAASFITLLLLGAFYNMMTVGGASQGFESNLNTFINSMELSLFLPGLPTVENQYEGFCYFGLGLIVCAVLSLFLLIGKGFCRFTARRVLILSLVVLFLVFSCFPLLSFGNSVLFRLPLPEGLASLLGVFRSNGRFIWPVYYILITAALTLMARRLSPKVSLCLLIPLLCLQILDQSPYLLQKHRLFSAKYEYSAALDQVPALLKVIDKYRHLVILPAEGIDTMDMAYFAYNHSLTTNRFYFARDTTWWQNATVESYLYDLNNDRHYEDFLYVCNDEFLRDNPLPDTVHLYRISDSVIIGSELPIDGLEAAAL